MHPGSMAVLAAALMFLTPRGVEAADVAGSVVGVAGDCFTAAGNQRSPLKLTDPVHVGDTLQVSHDGKLKLRMADGSIVSAAADSQFQIQSFQIDGSGERREAKLSLAAGLVRAVVSHTPHSGVFEVASAVGVAAARSTDWFVETQPNSMQVGVLSGVVDLKGAKAISTVSIAPGNGSQVEQNQPPVEPSKWPAARFDALIARTTIGIGWCQCINVTTDRKASCVPDQSACEAICGSKSYSIIPSAPQICGDMDRQ